MTAWEIPVLILLGVLGGMKTGYGAAFWKGREFPFYRIWDQKILYPAAAVWLVLYVGIWIFTEQSIPAVRFFDLYMTVILLGVLDVRRKMVSDEILVCFLIGQLLLALLTTDAVAIFACLASGLLFLGGALFIAWISKDRIGMGDAKFLGVLAMTAGWIYTVQMLFYSFLLAFLVSVVLLLFRRGSMKTEIPYVPFVAAAMIAHLFLVR